MKSSSIFFAILLFCVVFASCSKDHSNNKPASIPISTANLVSNWSLINDTTTTSFQGIWANNPTTGANYVGKSGDHYNFTSYGKLYIQQNNTLDTQSYELSHDTILVKIAAIEFPSTQIDSVYSSWYVVTKLTKTTCTITSFAWGPETVFNSIINLSR